MLDLTAVYDALRVVVTNPNVKITIPSCVALFIVIRLYRCRSHCRPRTTKLRGPPSKSFIFGVSKDLFDAADLGAVYSDWEKAYGSTYEIPVSLGSKMLVLGDPKAIAYVFARDTSTYHQLRITQATSRQNFGTTLFNMEGEIHKRQRKAFSSGFTYSATRNFTSIFLDTARKLETVWDSFFQSSSTDSVTIDVQQWMNYTSLDIIGISGFSHNFGCLNGDTSPAMAALDSFGTIKPSLAITLFFILGPLFPEFFSRLPNKRNKTVQTLARGVEEIAQELLTRAEAERDDTDGNEGDESIMGLLIKSVGTTSGTYMSVDEIRAQQLLMLAGYESTAFTLTWALIELCRHLNMQETLRAELRRELAGGEDPTYDQLMHGLPYLDAFTCEILRMHPAVPELMRETMEDDTIPLARPVRDASGRFVDRIFVAKGTSVRVPVAGVNRSEALWGANAETFDPGRWLVSDDDKSESDTDRKEEVQGYRHLLTFAHGPRTCLGKDFALLELKTVVSVLVRKFSFELPHGPETKLDRHRSFIVRPKVAGEEGPRVPLVIRRVE